MELKVKEKNNIIINNINTDRFKTNTICFSFISKTDGKDNYLTNYLLKILLYNTKKYNTKIKYAKKLEDLYSSSITANYVIMGNLKIIRFNIDYINSKYLEESIDKEAVDMLIETIFNPNVINKRFDKKSFELVKRNIITNKLRTNEYPVAYSIDAFLKKFSDGPSYYSLTGELKEIESVDESILYNYYKKIFDMNLDIALLGDNIKEDIANYILKKLENYKFKREKIDNVFISPVIKAKEIISKENKKFNQSQLLVGYKFKDLSLYERKYVLPIYNTILGGDINSILFKTVREENNLCYSIHSNANYYESTLVISSGINRKNYSLAIKLIKKCVENMNNKKSIEELIDVSKKNINTALNTFYDDGRDMIFYSLMKNYLMLDSVEKKRELFNNVKVDEVLGLNKKINKDSIYFLEGEK